MGIIKKMGIIMIVGGKRLVLSRIELFE